MDFVVLLLLFFFLSSNLVARKSWSNLVDPTRNITIKWNVVAWTTNGYIAMVSMYNFQQYRHIQKPGWTLGWTWAKKEVIWNMMGSQNTTSTCGCQNKTQPDSCVNPDSPHSTSIVPGNNTPLVQCTSHMCPIRVLWHVKLNYKEYWRDKITITNFNYQMNYSDWNVVIQHPNFNDLYQSYSFNYKPLNPYEEINDTGILWGINSYNDILSSAGYVQSEILFKKDKSTFTLYQGWAFPRKIYFNGDYCVMPPPDEYPRLPNASPKLAFSKAIWICVFLFLLEL